MSGFEIAGVVLGALPILFACVDMPKQGIQRGLLLFRKRAYVDKLARALLLQKQIIAENVKSVASAAGCDDVWLIDSNPYSYFNNTQVQTHILSYLGSENYTAFVAVLGQSHDILKKLALNLRGLLPGVGEPSEDLLEIIARNGDKTGKLELIPRVRLIFAVKDIKSAVEELDKTAADIDRFTRVVLSNRRELSGSASRKAIKAAKALCRVRDSAENLVFALQDYWRTGCHEKHEASLFLDDRLKISSANADWSARNKSLPPKVVFRLLLSSQTAAGPLSSYQTAVQVADDVPENDTEMTSEFEPGAKTASSPLDRHPHVQTTTVPQIDRPHTASPAPTRRRIRFQPMNTTAISKPSMAVPAISCLLSVQCICRALQSSLSDKDAAQFVLTRDGRIGLKQRTPSTPLNRPRMVDRQKTVSLEVILAQRSAPPHKNPLKFRMLLALRLASSFLQLHGTQWLRNTWTKRNVSFPLLPVAGQGAEVADLDQPFVSVEFSGSGATHSKGNQQPQLDLKTPLLELGIMLLEIWHQESFENRCSGDGQVPTGYYQRLARAIEWLDDAADPMPDQYEKAASLCIRCVIGGTSNFAGWDDMAFWSAVCADIIEPLQKNCEPWQRA